MSTGNTGNILVICTGNVCRSPYLERVLAAHLSGLDYVVSSAGTRALAGSPMEPESEERLVRAGGSPEGFQARQLTSAMVREADLVLTASREHRSDVVKLEPKGLRYTFALADLADLAEGVGVAPEAAAPGAERLRQVVAMATARRAELQPRSAQDATIIDPFRRGPEVFDQMAQRVDALLPPVVDLLR